MPRYVILQHELPADAKRATHWDFMIEDGDRLRSWALKSVPEREVDICAEPLADHRCLYLDYEGPVAGNRGHVYRWDAGSYQLVCEQAGRIDMRLSGLRLSGMATLWKIAGDQRWMFRWTSVDADPEG